MYKSKYLTALILIFLVFFSSLSQAEVYKYKDKYGRWQFTDKPVNDGKSQTQKKTLNTASSKGKSNLKEKLNKKYKSRTKVDEATLAVVKVVTKAGTGSGFFVTNDGFIITNRHVVRPSTTGKWKKDKVKLDKQKVEIDELLVKLRDDKENLKQMKAVIEEDREYMESDRASATHKKRYQRYINRYEKNKVIVEKNEKNYKKVHGKYKKKKSDYDWVSSMSNFATKFTIILKDGKKYKAKLIQISKNHDLALLKLDNYQTPFISVTKKLQPRQGDNVFAIGSPLGMSDSLTSGIITKIGKEYLVTDTQILPGNSGGPLIDDKGKVLGVNTRVKFSKGIGSLGLAIYAKHIRQEFNDKLTGRI